MPHCLCGVCPECKERARQIVDLIQKAEEFGKKHNVSPLIYLKILEEKRGDANG